MKIKDIGTVITGKTPSTKKSEFFDGEIPFVTPEDITNTYIVRKTKRFITESGFNSIRNNTISGISIAVGCIGSDMGNVSIVNGECATNQQINSITNINESVNPYYLYYHLSMKKDYLRQIAGSTTTPILPKSNFEQIEIPIPTIAVQNNIVSVLKPIDDKIENNNEISTRLEELAKTIYDYWFLQFDFPDKNGKPYKSSGGKMVYNNELKREIPEGWSIKSVSDIFNLRSGFSFSSKSYTENGKYKIYTIKNIQDGYINAQTDNFICELPPKMPNYCLLETGDILMSLTGNVGRVGIVYEPNALLNQRVLKINSLDRAYCYMMLRNPSMRLQLEKMSSGTSQKNLSPVEFGKMKVAHPSDDILVSFRHITEPIMNLIINSYKENEELIKLRDFLLPLLMSGQITIKD